MSPLGAWASLGTRFAHSGAGMGGLRRTEHAGGKALKKGEQIGVTFVTYLARSVADPATKSETYSEGATPFRQGRVSWTLAIAGAT
jgi:hypothetical protein